MTHSWSESNHQARITTSWLALRPLADPSAVPSQASRRRSYLEAWRSGGLRLVTLQEVSGAKSEQVPVEQFPGERQRGQGHQAVVDAPP